MTITELELIRKTLHWYRNGEENAETRTFYSSLCLQVIDREIRLKLMDPRKESKDDFR